MGHRIKINLVELLNNSGIDIQMQTLAISDEDCTMIQLAEVHFLKAASEKHGPQCFHFDVEISNEGRISLAADFNLWGSTFEPLTDHLHNNSVAYRVV